MGTFDKKAVDKYDSVMKTGKLNKRAAEYLKDKKKVKVVMGKKVDEAIDKILWCKENDSYPDYTPNEIETIDLPPWMTKKKDQTSSDEEIQLY